MRPTRDHTAGGSTPSLTRRVGNAVALLILMALAMGSEGAPAARAQDAARAVTVEAVLEDQRVFVGEPVRLQITVQGARAPAPPLIREVPGLELHFVGGQDVSRSYTSIINGRTTHESFDGYVFFFEITATKPGDYTLAPIEIVIDSRVHRTDPLSFSALDAQADPDVKLRLEIDNPEPYEGEPIRLRVVWGLTRQPTSPRFTLPGFEGAFEVVGPARPPRRDGDVVSILGFDTPLDRGQSTFEGQTLSSFTGELILIPRRAGSFTLGPGVVSCGVVVSRGRGFFAQDETRKVVAPSNAVRVNVKPLPSEGRPPNFMGLVGRYTLSATAEPRAVNVGDPIEFTLLASGPLASIAAPPAFAEQSDLARDFRIGSSTEAAAPSSDPSAAPESADRDRVRWRRTLRALREDVSRIPPVELAYFDPDLGRYEVARSPEIPIEVRPTRIVTASDALRSSTGAANQGAPDQPPEIGVEESASGIRHNYTGASLLADQSFDLFRAVRAPAVLVALTAPPLAYAGVAALALLRRVRDRRDTARRRRRRALSNARIALRGAGASPDRAEIVSAAVRACFADWFDRDPSALTPSDCLALATEADESSRAALGALLARCDSARFGAGAASSDSDLVGEAERLLSALDRLFGGRSK